MKWTLFFGSLLILSISLCGCVGSPCGPYGPYGSYSGIRGSASLGSASLGSAMCMEECDPCGTVCSPMNYAYGAGCAPIRGAAHVAATPVSWLAQILRGTNYPCHGCGDEVYWGDYGYVPDDFCNPCTYDGQWAGSEGGCGHYTVCQQGISQQHLAVGGSMNQMLAPIFQDKIASTHAKTPLNYGLRGLYGGACCDPCGYDSCFSGDCSIGSTGYCAGGHSGCATGCLGGVSPGYAPARQQTCLYGTGAQPCNCNNGNGHGDVNKVSTVSQASYRTAKAAGQPTAPVTNKVYPPVGNR